MMDVDKEMLQALKDNVIVIPVYEKRKSSLVIPDSAVKYQKYDGQVFGRVESVGPKFIEKYGRFLKPGDIMIWQRNEGRKMTYKGQDYLRVKEKAIFGKWVE